MKIFMWSINYNQLKEMMLLRFIEGTIKGNGATPEILKSVF